ncbi:F0F1 ATP synthase subunit gamma [Glaciecola sp. SC05]|uniref:F0F1 ATP synthase subunit gamma n=1 Tax=Glaciecola sp. SC05 TaxID=1987355 RepID=UPI003528382C
MTDSLESLRNRVDGANDLQAVVRTMKAMSASNITQYENAVLALNNYYETVQQGFSACLKDVGLAPLFFEKSGAKKTAVVIVFGSDQGLVGRFNDSLAEYVSEQLSSISAAQKVWVVGERMYDRLQDKGLDLEACLSVPSSVEGVSPLIRDLLIATEQLWDADLQSPLYLFHQKPSEQAGQYEPFTRSVLPMDLSWQKTLQAQKWHGPSLPETLGTSALTLRALIREYLFVSLYQSAAESLASENASRLIAMQRAEKNIEEMLTNLQHEYHHQRQESIDAELFDVVAGYSSDD